MILAAGRGERMGELTIATPKPLLPLAGHYLIEHVIYRLKRAGIHDIIINVSYLAEKIKKALGNGKRYGVKITYSEEKERLETGGGIVHALPLLGKQAFIVVSGDIVTDYPFEQLIYHSQKQAHLILIDNPSFKPQGDFGINNGYLSTEHLPKLTYANIGIYSPQFFTDVQSSHFPLSQLLFPAIAKSEISGEYYQGIWFNIGTPNDLAAAGQFLAQHPPFQFI